MVRGREAQRAVGLGVFKPTRLPPCAGLFKHLQLGQRWLRGAWRQGFRLLAHLPNHSAGSQNPDIIQASACPSEAWNCLFHSLLSAGSFPLSTPAFPPSSSRRLAHLGRFAEENIFTACENLRYHPRMRGFASLLMLCLFGACSDAPEEAARERTKRTRQLAEQGDPRAQFQLAQMYRTGDGLEQDLSQAVTWYSKAAEQGLPIAQHNLAVALDHGQGIAENKAESAKWYRRAAAQGQVSSQYSLARLLLLGQGGERDPAEAAHWFRRAAQTGHRDSIYHLGLMNRDGLGMPRNLVLSGKWLILAAKLGKLEAQGAYHTIASDLTPQQRQVAERLANDEQALLNRPAPVPM
ncbi:MAG TPA: sel1 repeat family protein, partial [Sulfitobacter sp.]|nr:sel1 repeat family protein [Sulfitobacter sp.]